jgi:putrescine aminotransferase
MDSVSTTGSRDRAVITLEQALARPANEAFTAFARHVNPVEARLLRLGGFDKLYARARGLYFHDARGRRYMDFTAGFGALNLGHGPEEVLAAVQKAQSLPAVLLAGFSPLAGALAEALSSILPGGLSVACFGSGGAEAVELALKTARAATGRTRFVSCGNAYHGLSFGAMSVSGDRRYRAIFGPLVEHCESVPFGDAKVLEEKLRNNDVAAFIVEPIQGEGGAVVPPQGYLKAAEEVCHAHGTLLIVDEIQTGLGRTGRLFAVEHDGAAPDMVLLSKSLAAGVVPVSVCSTTPEIWDRAFGRRDRFDLVISTFGGNAAACAAGLKAIEITLRDDLAGRAAALGQHAAARLRELTGKHESVRAIRGKGLLLGVELSSPISGAGMDENFALMVASCLLNDHGVLTTYFDLAPNILRYEPPLIVSRAEIDCAIDAFDHVLGLGVGGLALSAGKNAIGRILHGAG